MSEQILYEELIDNVTTNLKIISLVQKNEKLCIRKGHLQIDKISYFRFIKRYYYNDSRETMIRFLKQLLKDIKIIKDFYFSKHNIIDNIDSIELGINNLQVTYSQDPVIVASLDNILNKLKIIIKN
jgi:hypothetical protein